MFNDGFKIINRSRVDNEYWIDTFGKLHRYKGRTDMSISSFHSEIAKQYYPHSNRPTDVLFNLGWIMVGSTVYNDPIIHKKPTQAQLNILYRLDLYKTLHVIK